MKALIQRVKRASVTIDGNLYSQIGGGLLVFLGVEKSDTELNAEKLADKIIHLRIFEDDCEKMNKSVLDVNGEILVVSQFTLYGDCKIGSRPSLRNVAAFAIRSDLYHSF